MAQMAKNKPLLLLPNLPVTTATLTTVSTFHGSQMPPPLPPQNAL